MANSELGQSLTDMISEKRLRIFMPFSQLEDNPLIMAFADTMSQIAQNMMAVDRHNRNSIIVIRKIFKCKFQRVMEAQF